MNLHARQDAGPQTVTPQAFGLSGLISAVYGEWRVASRELVAK